MMAVMLVVMLAGKMVVVMDELRVVKMVVLLAD